MKETTLMHTQILAIICSVFDAYSATLYLPHTSGRYYYLAATFSLGDSDDYCEELSAGMSLVGNVLRENTPLVMMNFDKAQHKLGYYKNEEECGIKAFMGCPIPTGGILCVDSKKLYSFSDKDSKILQLFADLVNDKEDSTSYYSDSPSVAEYFACLGILRSLRFQYKAWSTFLLNYLRTIAHTLRYDYCAFSSLDPSEECYVLEGESRPILLEAGKQRIFTLQSGMVGWVFRDEQQAIFSEGLTGTNNLSLYGKDPSLPQFQAIICAPVVVNKTARGVLCLAHSEGRQMDDALQSFVHQCVDSLGLFLENLYLRSRLHQLLPKAQVHEHISRAYGTNHQKYSEED